MTQPPQTTYWPAPVGQKCQTGIWSSINDTIALIAVLGYLGDYSSGPSCEKYYVCVGGTKTLQSCGTGLHWNDGKKLCDWPNNANCQPSFDPSDPGKKHYNLVIKHFSYFYCLEHGTKRPIRLPKNCQEGEYFGSDEDCSAYFICNHGQPLQFACQDGLYWNQQAKVCDWPQNAGCQLAQTVPTTTSAPIYTDAPPPSTPKLPTGILTPRPTTIRPTTTRPTTARPTTTQRPTTARPVTTRPTTYLPTTTDLTTSTTMGSEVVQPDPGSNTNDFMIVCYFTNWAWYRPGIGKYKPDDINSNLCTHIVYGFAVLDYTDLVMKPHDTWADFDNHFYEQVTAFKKRGAKVTLAIGGWNDSQGDKYSRLVNNPSARRKFITQAIEFLKKNNFDGLDLGN
jgi:chitinase